MKKLPIVDSPIKGYTIHSYPLSIMLNEPSEYSNAIVHAFQKFRAPFSGKIVHIFPEQSAVI